MDSSGSGFRYSPLEQNGKTRRPFVMEKFYVVRKVDRGQHPIPNQNQNNRPAGKPPPTIGYPQPIVSRPLNVPPLSGANRTFTEAVTGREFAQDGSASPSVRNRSFNEAVTRRDHRQRIQRDYAGPSSRDNENNNRPQSDNFSGRDHYYASVTEGEAYPHSMNASVQYSRGHEGEDGSRLHADTISISSPRTRARNSPKNVRPHSSSMGSPYSKPAHSHSHSPVKEIPFSKQAMPEKIPRSVSDNDNLKGYSKHSSEDLNELNKSFADAMKHVKSIDYTKDTSFSNSKLARSNMYSSMPSLIDDPEYSDTRTNQARSGIDNDTGKDFVDGKKVQRKPPVMPRAKFDVGHGPLLQKIMILCDGLKFGECSVFINRLSRDTVMSMLHELPIQTLLDAIPKSLGTIHTIYSKMLPLSSGAACAEKSNPEEIDLIKKALRLDETLRLIVKLFACQEDPLAQVERTESVTYHCKGVLKIIAQNKPQIKQKLYKKNKALERCLSGLGHHGPIPMQDGKLASLHDALKQEFMRTVQQYKNAMQKLEESQTMQKATSRSSVTSLSEESNHQRMLQCNQVDVENRLIKNKTLFNAIEPVITNQFLARLIQLLEERITCDKAILFNFTELRKQSKDAPLTSQVAPFFHRYSTAYSRVLEIIQDVTNDDLNLDEVSDSDLETLETWSGSSIRSFRERNPSALWIPVPSPDSKRKSVTKMPNGLLTPDHQSKAGSFSNSKGYMQLDPEGRMRNSFNGATVFGGDSTGRDLNFCTDHFQGFPAVEEAKETDKAENLRDEVEKLKKELNKAKETITKLEEREKLLKERMTAEAQKGIQSGTRFEDLNLGENRPTQLVRRYGNLYSQVRVDTLDALDTLEEVAGFDDLKGKLLFSVIVLAFRSVQESVAELKTKLHTLLQLPQPGGASGPDDTSCTEMERSIIIYLKKTADRFDLTKNISEVSDQLWQTLYDYPSLKTCQPLHQYIDESVRLAWALSVQNPPLVIDYDAVLYKADIHTRFYLSDSESDAIKSMIWPGLLEGENGPCVFKGVVLT